MESPKESPEKSLAVVPSGEDKPVDPLGWLDAAERYAYDHFLKKRQDPAAARTASYSVLAPSVVTQMEVLYIKGGKTLPEIRALYPQFSLGQVVNAAVQENFHLKRAADIQITAQRAKIRAELSFLEGMEMAADVMAAIRALHGDRIARFLATRDVNHLEGSSPIVVLRQLKEAAAVLAQLTGKDQVKRVAVSGNVTHSISLPTIPPPQPAPGEESSILQAWAATERAKLEKDLKD
jgi:hypothetical protein